MEASRAVNVTATSDLLQLAREVARSGVSVVLKIDNEDLAVLSPASKPKRRTARSRITADEPDTILNIIGIGESKEPTDIAAHKHEYLAEAYESTNS